MALRTIVRTVYRSAITGRFVTKAYAQSNPDTTLTERVEVLVHYGSD